MILIIVHLLLLATTLIYGQNAELVLDLNLGSQDGIVDNARVLGTIGNAIVIANDDHILYSNGTSEETKNIHNLSNSEIVAGRLRFDGHLYLAEYNTLDSSRIIRISETGVVDTLLEESGFIELYLEFKDKIYFKKRSNFTEFLCSIDPTSINPTSDDIEEIIETRWFMRDGLKDMIVYNDLIYMILWPENMTGSFLASYDGEANIDLIHEFYSANVDMASRTSVNMTIADTNLFFWFGDGTHDGALYVTDGTSDGTQVLNTENERYYRSLASRTIGVIGNKVLFEGIDADNDRHLWSSDGTIDGTFRIEVPSGIEMNPRYFTTLNDKLFFSGYYGSQPFDAPSISTLQTDGTIEGTEVILQPTEIPNNNISNGYWLTSHNDSLFMVGRKVSWPFNNDLYKSDGTAEGTKKVSSIGEESGNEISQIVSAGQNLFFIGKTDSLGRELYLYKSALIDLDGDGFFADEDCDDNNPNINPAQIEEPYNGIDDDCDALTLDDDLDQDGFSIAEDCNDDNSAINPNAVEIPNNGIDEDCDGMDLLSSTYDIANTTVNIHPNPVIDIIYIDVVGQLSYKVSLYDLQGQLILTAYNESQINLSSLPPGTYLLELHDLNSTHNVREKIVIAR